MEELTYIPQPSISISQNIVTITSLAPVKFTIDGSDPIYYGLLYTGPFSINSFTVIKAVAFNENYVSEMVVGSFSPETDIVDGASGSEWTPSSGDGITIEELSAMSYATTSYVVDYVASYGGNVDLSDYTTFEDISGMGYLTSIPSEYITQDELSANSYLTSIPNTYPTYAAIENMSYITMTDVSACGYITASDIPSVVVPVIDENLIPKENNTYTLGTSSYLYESAYLSRLNLNGDKVYLYSNGIGQLKFGVNGADRFRINYNTFEPSISGETSLGRSDNPFTNSYITNLYTSYIVGTTYLSSYSYLMIGTDRPWYLYGTGGEGYESVVFKANIAGKYFMIKDVYNNDIVRIYEVNATGNWIQIPAKINSNIIPNVSASYTLGSADSRWKELRTQTTYTDNIYLGNTDINDKFIPTEGGTITGRLESTYYTTVNYLGGISSYSSILVGADDRNSVTMLATRRLCGETSYAAAFFTNSDGRSKFTHKTKTNATTAIGSNDDAFLCFNAYGFKLAYSGTPGTSATTEYDLIHSGNIDNYLATSYSLGKVHVGTAVTSSTSSTAVCTVTVDTFELDSNNKPLSGTQIAFKVTSATSVNGVAMKLNVNSTGNISMYYDNAVVTSTNRNWYRDCTRVNGWYYFIFDGTYWVWQNCSSENNNTYSTMTDANMQAGTETSGRLVTAKQLATYYTAKSCFSFDSSTNTLTITTT